MQMKIHDVLKSYGILAVKVMESHGIMERKE